MAVNRYHAGMRFPGRLLATVLLAGSIAGCRIPFLEIPTGQDLPMDAARLRLAELENHVPPRPPDDLAAVHWQNARTVLQGARYLASRYRPTDYVITNLNRRLRQAAFELDLAGRHRNGIVPGRLEEGYYDDADDSFQPFVRYLPHSARRNRPMPLVVFLHGYSPQLNIVNWSYLPESLIAFAEQQGWALAAPFGRSNTDYQGIGERDVLRVIDEMQRRYRIDPDRIILAGVSMGGMGVWTIGAHYPDRFAGLVILAGRGDYYFWQDTPRDTLPPHKRRLIDAEFASELLPNLASLPIFCMHGARDTLIPVAEARHIVDAVRTANPSIRYIELPEAEHWFYEEAFEREDLRDWLRARRRQAPSAFRYRSFHPRYDGAHGISAIPAPPGLPPLEVAYRITAGQMDIAATHASGIVLAPDRMSRAQLRARLFAAPNLSVRRLGPGETLPRVPRGPVKQAFLDPFAFVCTADPTNVVGMLDFQARCREWYRYAKANPRVLYEMQLATNRLRELNVFVFGEPETSALARRILQDSPVRITRDAFLVDGRSIPRAGHGLYMVYRSPWNPDRLAVLQCGLPWGQSLPENHKYDLLPDYIIYTADTDPDGCNRAVFAGFFDDNWQIDPRLVSVAPPTPPDRPATEGR